MAAIAGPALEEEVRGPATGAPGGEIEAAIPPDPSKAVGREHVARGRHLLCRLQQRAIQYKLKEYQRAGAVVTRGSRPLTPPTARDWDAATTGSRPATTHDVRALGHMLHNGPGRDGSTASQDR